MLEWLWNDCNYIEEMSVHELGQVLLEKVFFLVIQQTYWVKF